ncbi:MurR/RpiR family transcriptional regulator [Amycolatopsis sp. WQ 127309]|uniref:MurR/RpiR family transcriptional regulator n=1 Tax=Amycolatopsis sp. WQ 127309 TaxID=2932773 RepID=UPI001FF29A2C|nr:MurR/RpiR family transcriptional regulator [Amycolatopsis sp. WQ 127309]UOZ02963.1 MurR/RpiR family transcriptional regulator [Amycolatopsis sp. WQ 127309]
MDTTELSLQDRITGRLALLPAAERKVAEYLRNHGPDAIFATAGQIAAATGTSDATVVRTARSLGYTGLLELRHSLTRQVVRATSPAPPPGPEGSLLTHVFAEATRRLADTLRLTSASTFDTAVDVLAGAREVLAFGIGPSETVAAYLALRLRRLGRRARATGATGFRLADDLLELARGDVVVLYSPSRLLAEIDVVLDHAAAVGARAVLISDSLGPVFADRVHVTLAAAHTPTGATGEGLPSQVLTDALVLGVRAKDETRATERAELLTGLRSELSQTGGRRRTTQPPHRKESP